LEESSQKTVVALVFLLALIPVAVSIPTLFSESPTPTGMSIAPPADHDPLASKMLLVILDGVPAHVMEDPDYMPNLAAWSQNGSSLDVNTGEMTLTGPCSKEMLTGLHASPTDAARNWEVQYDGTDDPLNYAEDAGLEVGFTGFYVWRNLFPAARFEHRTIYDNGFSDVYDMDNSTLAVVREWIVDDSLDLMIAHLTGTDHAGHIWGVRSDEYRTKMNILDEQLEEIRLLVPDDWVMMITADHGMTNHGGHAISTGEDAMRVNLYAVGPAFKAGSSTTIEQRDISALFTVILDLPFPVSADARIPVEVLAIDPEDRMMLEAWNWEAAVARQEWLGEQGLNHESGISIDKVEWDRIPVNQMVAGPLDVAASMACLVGLAALCWYHRIPKIESGPRTWVSIGIIVAIWAMNNLIYFYAYDSAILGVDSSRIRKWIGIDLAFLASLLILGTVFSNDGQERRWFSYSIDWIKQRTSSWFPLAFLAITLWQPDARLSPSLLALLLALPVVRWWKSSQFKTAHWVFLSILVFSLWSIWNFLMKKLTGMTFQQWTNIDFLYKFELQTVHSFMIDNQILAIVAVTVGIWLAARMDTPYRSRKWWPDATVLSAAVLIYSLGYSSSDRILLLVIAFCYIAALFERFRGVVLRPSLTTLSFAEWGTLLLIIPTWGAWAAMVTLLLSRCIVSLFRGEESLPSRCDDSGWSADCHYLANALLPFFFCCIVWINFGQLTMVGLVEFNPSKWIVSGGFIGARVAPPVGWMAFITIAPTIAAVSTVLNSWMRTGRPLMPLFLLLSYLLLVSMSHVWISFMRPQVLIMVAFSSIVALFWYLAAFISYTMSKDRDPSSVLQLQS
jgi:hypothetical protein